MITKDSLLPDVIARHPGTRGVFDRHGLHGCGGPLGPAETVEFFSRVHAVPLESLLSELEAAQERLTAEMRVAQIVEWYPATLEVFERFGFKELKNPVLRNTIARRVTVRMACGLKHIDEAEFLSALQVAAH